MYETDEDSGLAVLFAFVVFILVIVYCRMTVGEVHQQQRRHTNLSQDAR